MMLNFRKGVLEIWLKRYNSHVFAFAETNVFQVNGEICPLSFPKNDAHSQFSN